jgi:hypothetical protein
LLIGDGMTFGCVTTERSVTGGSYCPVLAAGTPYESVLLGSFHVGGPKPAVPLLHTCRESRPSILSPAVVSNLVRVVGGACSMGL